MSDEDKLAAKLRMQKIQEEADLRVAMDTFGVTDSDLVASGVIDGAQPTNKEELEAFKNDLVKKIVQFKTVDGFGNFVEELVQGLCVTCKYFDEDCVGVCLCVSVRVIVAVFDEYRILQWAPLICRKSRRPWTICTRRSRSSRRRRAKRAPPKENRRLVCEWKEPT